MTGCPVPGCTRDATESILVSNGPNGVDPYRVAFSVSDPPEGGEKYYICDVCYTDQRYLD